MKKTITLKNDRKLVISSLARSILHFYNVDEEVFLDKLNDLFETVFPSDAEFPFHRVYVGKSSFPYGAEFCDSIRIEIADPHKKVKGA